MIQVEKAHGRIEKRKVQTSTALNDYLNFPHVHQVFRIERSVTMVKSEKRRHEVVFGVTSCPPERADPARIGELARGQWGIASPGGHCCNDLGVEPRGRLEMGAVREM